MTVRGKALAGLGALLLAWPGAAGAAGLECMAQSYGAEELAEIAALSTRFSFDDSDPQSTGDELSQIGIEAAQGCSGANGWSENELYYAMLFELGRLSEAAYRLAGHLTAGQLRAIDDTLAGGERVELWTLMERAVIAGLEGREPQSTPEEDFVLGSFLMTAGFGDDEAVGTKVGELLGTMALWRIGRREFAWLAQGE